MTATAVAGAVGGQDRLVEVEPTAIAAVERRPVGAGKTFRPYEPDQVLLMAPVLSEWVPDPKMDRVELRPGQAAIGSASRVTV